LARGRCALKLGQYAVAIDDFTALESGQPEARKLLAGRIAAGGRRSSATRLRCGCGRLWRGRPVGAEIRKAYLGRGQCHLQQKQYAAAIADLEQARQWMELPWAPSPRSSPRPTSNADGESLNQKDPDKAIADFEEAIRLAPEGAPIPQRDAMPTPTWPRGTRSLEQQDYPRAIADLKQAGKAAQRRARVQPPGRRLVPPEELRAGHQGPDRRCGTRSERYGLRHPRPGYAN